MKFSKTAATLALPFAVAAGMGHPLMLPVERDPVPLKDFPEDRLPSFKAPQAQPAIQADTPAWCAVPAPVEASRDVRAGKLVHIDNFNEAHPMAKGRREIDGCPDATNPCAPIVTVAGKKNDISDDFTINTCRMQFCKSQAYLIPEKEHVKGVDYLIYMEQRCQPYSAATPEDAKAIFAAGAVLRKEMKAKRLSGQCKP